MTTQVLVKNTFIQLTPDSRLVQPAAPGRQRTESCDAVLEGHGDGNAKELSISETIYENTSYDAPGGSGNFEEVDVANTPPTSTGQTEVTALPPSEAATTTTTAAVGAAAVPVQSKSQTNAPAETANKKTQGAANKATGTDTASASSGRGGSGANRKGAKGSSTARGERSKRRAAASISSTPIGDNELSSPATPAGRTEEQSQVNSSQFEDPPPGGESGPTTIMLRNIPNKYTQKMVLDVMNDEFRGLYDFFYLPIDFRNKCNVGYAFVNFIHPHYAKRFKKTFHGYKLDAFKSNKICEVSWGRVQGLDANVEHYRNSAVMSIAIPHYKPILLQNGLAVPFPKADGPLPNVKLRPQKAAEAAAKS